MSETSSPVDAWLQEQRVSTATERQAFIAAIKQGKVEEPAIIAFCQALDRRIAALETKPREPEKRGPCQCANCQGYNGWFASCLGYTP